MKEERIRELPFFQQYVMKLSEHDMEMGDAKPNKPCSCNSGKKFKACCKKILDKMGA